MRIKKTRICVIPHYAANVYLILAVSSPPSITGTTYKTVSEKSGLFYHKGDTLRSQRKA